MPTPSHLQHCNALVMPMQVGSNLSIAIKSLSFSPCEWSLSNNPSSALKVQNSLIQFKLAETMIKLDTNTEVSVFNTSIKPNK